MNGCTELQPAPVLGADHLVELLRTLADPIRLRILRLLETQPANSAARTGGLSVRELGDILKLPQSTVSRHLKILSEARLAEPRRDGTSMYYRLSEQAGLNAGRQLRNLARTQLEDDPRAKTDAHRLAATLRKRSPRPASERFFGRHAPEWDQLRARWFGETFHLEGLLTLLDPRWTVADVGAGTGAMLPFLAPHVRRVIAVEPSPTMLKAARGRVRNLRLDNIDIRRGDAETLPIESASVDVALLALVLAYTADPPVALKEVRRILKPGGIALIIDLQAHSAETFRDKLHHRWMGFSREQLAVWLRDAGFTAPRWHALAAGPARTRNDGGPVPDLFALRAEAE